MATVDELIERAFERTGLHACDSESFVEGLTVLVDAVDDCDRVTEWGTARLEGLVVDHLARRLRIDDYIAAHPGVAESPVRQPVLVLGMPRTGTTAVINLLNQDPRFRTVLRWTLEDPVPPPTTEGLHTDPRCRRALARQRQAIAEGVAGANIRFEWADSPAECVHVMNHDFKAMQWEASAPMPAYSKFIFSCDMRSAYAWHKRTLQLLQSQAPGRWALKAPSHALWIPTILDTYPDARLVWTHRDPFTAVASMCSLAANAHRRNCDAADIDYIHGWYPTYMAEHVHRPMAVLGALGERIFHLHYADFVRDEIDTMRSLYRWLGGELSVDVEARMAGWLAQRRQAQLGGHRYSLEDFGLNRDELEPLFDDYISTLGVELDGEAAT